MDRAHLAAAIAFSSSPAARSGRSLAATGSRGGANRNRLWAWRRATPNSQVLTSEALDRAGRAPSGEQRVLQHLLGATMRSPASRYR
jgi:hypothetical protein